MPLYHWYSHYQQKYFTRIFFHSYSTCFDYFLKNHVVFSVLRFYSHYGSESVFMSLCFGDTLNVY